MSNPALLMLLERLLWPVPRVRWEAGRSLARLIREGDVETANGLLNWISARRLESEAVLGLGIIDAFDLGACFEFAGVSKAVRAPSHLSDWLLKQNFSNAHGLSSFRYTVSPSEPATLPQHVEAWFERYREQAALPIFSSVLARLEQVTAFPFQRYWEHDWRWLQATHPRPVSAAGFSYFFFGRNRGRSGHFVHGQGELYVSAYLRTLAFAAITGKVSHEAAENYAMPALTMNRGLADVEPVERPDWTRDILPCSAGQTKELAQKLWESAEAAAQSGEVPIALKVVDLDAKGFIEFDLTLTIGPSGFTVGPAEAKTLKSLEVGEHSGKMEGLVYPEAGIDPLSIDHPLIMAQGVLPTNIGHVHSDMVLDIRLASPYVFRTHANLQCSPSHICLEAGPNVLSRWIHWYADWEPTTFTELTSSVGSMTTVLKSSLDKLRASHGVETARLVQLRRATMHEMHQELEVEVEAYWI